VGRLEDLVELDPALVEEAVLQAADGSSRETLRRYRKERDAIYEIEDSDRREAAFREMDARWFRKLRLDAPLVDLLREFEPLFARICRAVVLMAARLRDEGADLHEGPGGLVLALRLTPGSVLDFERAATFLRSELLHVEDMLDPAFGYERDPPSIESDPVYEKLVRDRYRVLWNTSVDGRLAREGRLPSEGEARRRREFLATFSMLGSEAEGHFERFFHGPRPSHGDFLSFAREVDGRAAGKCPLCRFPTARFRGEGEPLKPEVEDRIRRDFPEWSVSEGICMQCADLYEARTAWYGTSHARGA
jgi:hypothetical protein